MSTHLCGTALLMNLCKNRIWTEIFRTFFVKKPNYNSVNYSIVKDSYADLTVGNWNSKKDP